MVGPLAQGMAAGSAFNRPLLADRTGRFDCGDCNFYFAMYRMHSISRLSLFSQHFSPIISSKTCCDV